MRNLLKTRAGAFLSAAALSIAAAGTAVAQQPAPPPSQPQSIAPVEDAEIKKFAAALKEVNNVLETANTDIQNSTDPDEAAQLEMEAREDVVEAITDEGLTPERYNQIMQLAQSDQDTMAKLQAELES